MFQSNNKNLQRTACKLAVFGYLILSLGCSPNSPNVHDNDRAHTKIADSATNWLVWQRMGLDEQKLKLPRPQYPADVCELIGVTDSGVSGATFNSWKEFKPNSDRVELLDLETIEKNTEVFDCSNFVLNQDLKNALILAQNLKWLRVGKVTSKSDMAWLASLKGLRGLDLSGSDFSDADLTIFTELNELRWLSIYDAKLAKNQLPSIPKLEVLLMGSSASDNNIPTSGQFPILKAFDCGSSLISGNGLAQLVSSCPRIEYLFAAHTNLTEKSIASLAKLQHMKYTHLGTTPLQNQRYEVEFNTIPELQVKLPNCFIALGD